jgi:hypothetical protein
MKTRNQDYQEIQNFINGTTQSFVMGINERGLIPQDVSSRTFAMLLEDEDGDYCMGHGQLTGTPLDLFIIPSVMGKVQEDGNRIVCIMEMVYKEDENKAVFVYRGEMGEDEEKFEDTHIFKVEEGEMYIGEDGSLVYPLSVMEVED